MGHGDRVAIVLNPRKAFYVGLFVTINDAFWAALQATSPVYMADTRAADLAVWQYTSGTTRALPEAVKHTHRSVVTLMMAALYRVGLRPGDRYFCPSARAWGHGFWGDMTVQRKGQWFSVKDRGYCDAEGYFYHEERADDVIMSAGWTMSAIEIEQTLLAHVKPCVKGGVQA